MKNIKFLIVLLIAAVGFNSCDQEDDLTFVALEPGEFVLTNEFLQEYVLPADNDANDNLGVLFVWNTVDFDVPTNVSYEVQNSILGDFTDALAVDGTSPTSENNLTLSIGQLKALAEAAAIDNPGTGELTFRIRAFVGDDSSTTESFSTPQTIIVTLQEASTGCGSDIEPATWGVVGSGYNNWGGFTDGQFYTTAEADVFVAYVTLVTGEIKFRENNAWDNDFGDTGADGTLDAGGDNIAVTDGTYKITMNLNDNTYTIEPFSWGVVGSGYNDWGATPDAKFYYDYTTDTFKVGVRLVDGEIKFRQNNAWDSDFGDTGADGTLDAGGDNIAVTAGHYTITLDFNNSLYTIEAADLYGVVGSGYNDWGATQDYTLTPLSNDILVGDIVTLIDGEIKFRVNDAWDSDFGDTGADGTLDVGGDNIAVTAGDYRIMLDLANNTYELNQVN